MAMDRDRDPVVHAWRILNDAIDQREIFVRGGVPYGIRNIQSCRTGLDRFAEHNVQEFRIGTPGVFRRELDILAKLSDQLGKMMRAGYGPADMLAAGPAKEYAQRLGDPTEFLTESFKSLWPRVAPDA